MNCTPMLWRGLLQHSIEQILKCKLLSPQIQDLRGGGVWGGLPPRESSFLVYLGHKCGRDRPKKIQGGSATLQTSRLAGDRVSPVRSRTTLQSVLDREWHPVVAA